MEDYNQGLLTFVSLSYQLPLASLSFPCVTNSLQSASETRRGGAWRDGTGRDGTGRDGWFTMRKILILNDR